MDRMKGVNFIYAPNSEVAKQFRCKVPMKGTKQLFVINGGVQGTLSPLEVNVEENRVMEELLQIISVRTEGGELTQSYKSTFRFEKGCVGRVLLCSHTFTLDSFVTQEDVKINVEDGACVDMIIMQNEHSGAIHRNKFSIELGSGASLKMVFLTLHGGEIDNDISVELKGEHGSVDLGGLYLVDGEQKVTNRVKMNHYAPKCNSSQLFRGVLDDKSNGNFYGTIYVKKDAQKIDAFQANHNLLLSDCAKVHSEPQLEIYADDVKCSHGATTGRLDENEAFYLRSRGVRKEEARLLQQMAFAYSVLEKISNVELRERMENLVEKRLRGEFSTCHNCSKNCC